jgi:hypothetical protein
VHQAVALSPGTLQARHGTWWLQNNSIHGVNYVFNIQGDLLPYPDAPEAPTELIYHSPGAGALFARTSWDTDASWMAFVAGKYDQSHAHQEQGNFTFFKNDWLSVTSNIWSHSGIHQEVTVNNVVRFERTDGSRDPAESGRRPLDHDAVDLRRRDHRVRGPEQRLLGEPERRPQLDAHAPALR